MARWTLEQVLAAAPDDSARKAAKGLTSPRHWSDLGSTESLLWGKCQGSGKDPYQVSVDLNGPAFRCTCPSRKFPCKHGLALMLMWAANDGSVIDVQEVSAFAAEWAAERDQKSVKAVAKAERLASGEDTVDPEAKAKREAKRASLIDAGVADLERWLCDVVRQGTAAVRSQPYSFWDQPAARLVDAQAPGLAEQVRALATVAARPNWSDALLRSLSRLMAITAAWARREQLDEPALAELRRVIGWARQSDEVLSGGTTEDEWTICGRTQETNGTIATQRTWLWSHGNQDWSVQLDTAVGNTNFSAGHGVGMGLRGRAALYPGLPPRRLLAVVVEPTSPQKALPGALSLTEAVTNLPQCWPQTLGLGQSLPPLETLRLSQLTRAFTYKTTTAIYSASIHYSNRG